MEKNLMLLLFTATDKIVSFFSKFFVSPVNAEGDPFVMSGDVVPVGPTLKESVGILILLALPLIVVTLCVVFLIKRLGKKKKGKKKSKKK